MENIKAISCVLVFAFTGVILTYSGDSSSADKHIHGSHSECALPQSTNDIIACAIKFHPKVVRLKLSLNASQTLIEPAKQLQNPTLKTKYLKADSEVDNSNSTEASISFPVDIGGKRDARVSYAKAKIQEYSTTLDIGIAEVKVDTVLNLYRLRQIKIEKYVLKNTLSAFNNVISKLKQRSRLSAEQEASLTLFELARDDSRISASVLYDEEREIEHFFHVSTGHSLQEILAYVPKELIDWPNFDETISTDKVSLEIKKNLATEKININALGIEESIGWSDINIGPSFNIENDGQNKNTSIGFNISFSLPLFHANDGAKAHARSNLAKARKYTELAIKEEKHERAEQLKIYGRSLSVLKMTMKSREINLKYKRIQELYLRGVVSNSIFLESQKQKAYLLKGRHKREMAALTALWAIYKIDGKVLEVKI